MSDGAPKRRSRARRALLSTALASVALGAIGALVLIGLVGGDRDGVDRATAQMLSRGVSSIAQGVGGVLGQAWGSSDQLETGLRSYEPAQGAWSPIGSGADAQTLPARVVLLIHGLDEPGGIWDQLAPALSDDGYTLLRFDYRNDQSIELSADELSASLERLVPLGVEELDLVCHSMGGLVARDWLTREDGYGEGSLRVGTLITLGTPHEGSPWARLRGIAEMREQVQRWAESDDLDPARLLGFLDDGTGQAGIDLLPGSAYLQDLNARSMPEGVEVVCVVGRTDEPGTQAGVISSVAARGALHELLGERQAGLILDELERMGQELGDGVVPVSSAKLEGADKVVYVRANHRSMIRTIELEEAVRTRQGWPDAPEPPGIEIVREELRDG